MCTTQPSGAVDRDGLEEMLRRLQKVDLESVSRVADSKVGHPETTCFAIYSARHLSALIERKIAGYVWLEQWCAH